MLKQKYEEVKKQNTDEPTDQVCEACGKPMVIRFGRFGRFLACTGFPDCKNTKPIKETIGISCPSCSEGEIVVKKTKKGGRIFFGCSRYPACDYASWQDPRKESGKTQKKSTD